MRALTDDERDALTIRATELRERLFPYADSERNEVEANIAAMLGGFRSMRQQGDDAEGIVAATASVLREFPLWAIAKGCIKIARNDAGLDRRFAPNDTEIFEVISNLVGDYHKALVNAEGLLGAEVRPAIAARAPEPPDVEGRLTLLAKPMDKGRTDEKRISDGKHAERVAADLVRRRNQTAAA